MNLIWKTVTVLFQSLKNNCNRHSSVAWVLIALVHDPVYRLSLASS